MSRKPKQLNRVPGLDQGELTALKAMFIFEHSQNIDVEVCCKLCEITMQDLVLMRETDPGFKDKLDAIKKSDDVALEFMARKGLRELAMEGSESTRRAILVHLDKKYDGRSIHDANVGDVQDALDPVPLDHYAAKGVLKVTDKPLVRRTAAEVPDDVGTGGQAVEVEAFN